MEADRRQAKGEETCISIRSVHGWEPCLVLAPGPGQTGMADIIPALRSPQAGDSGVTMSPEMNTVPGGATWAAWGLRVL